MNVQFRSELLSAEHDTADFVCGVLPLDDWLKTQALRAQRAGSARTFVWTHLDPSSHEVLAYYSIAPATVASESVSRAMSGGYSAIPAWLIGKLALHSSLHGRGLGPQLLLDALDVIVTVAERGGGRLIVVDAVNETAAAFYRRHDFQPARPFQASEPSRLVMKVATARAVLHRD